MTAPVSSPAPTAVTNTISVSGRGIGLAGGSVTAIFHQYDQLGSRRIDDDELIQAGKGFVASGNVRLPSGEHGGVVVLCGKRFIGRRTAALQVLSGFRERVPRDIKLGIRELIPRWARPDIDLLPEIQHRGWLLDLSDADDRIDADADETGKPSAAFGADLVEYADQQAELGSLIVIIVTPEVWSDAAASTASLTVPWQAPRAMDVVKAHLREDRPDRIEWLSESSELAGLLGSSALGPADAADLAHYMRRESATEAEAIDSLKQWTTKLRKWFTANTNPFHRAVLISSAAFGVATRQEIVDAADKLTTATGEGGGGESLLGAPDLIERLSTLPTDADMDPVDINLLHPDLDVAIMDWVWRQRPKVLPKLQEWLVGLAIDPEGSSQQRLDRIAGVFAAHVTRRGHPLSGLLDFVKKTAAVGDRHHELAVRILDELVLDPVAGRQTRARLLAWSVSRNETQIGLVASVCGRRLGHERTTLALLRLSKVLANGSATDEVREFAGRSMRELAQVTELRRAVLLGVNRLFETNARAGAAAFLELAIGGELGVGKLLEAEARSDPDFRDELGDMWKQTRVQVGPRLCGEAMGMWFRAVDEGEFDAATVLDILMPAIREEHDSSLAAISITDRSEYVVKSVLEQLRDFDLGRRRTR